MTEFYPSMIYFAMSKELGISPNDVDNMDNLVVQELLLLLNFYSQKMAEGVSRHGRN